MEKDLILVSGGGTGGHIYPGICLAGELRSRGYEVKFIVSRNDYCIPLLKKENYGFIELNIIGLSRKLSFGIIVFLFRLMGSFVRTLGIFLKYKPAAVVGLGGYTSFPIICVSKMFGVPSLIHEQNYLPGLANKMLASFADRIAVNFEGTKESFKKRDVVVSGNPVRKGLLECTKEEGLKRLSLDKDRFTVLVFGGSQGAHSINKYVAEGLDKLNDLKDRIQFIHITGRNDFSFVQELYGSSSIKSAVFHYFHDMGHAYAAADLVISRAGATTVSELLVLGKKSVLIPYPYATDNHQYYNAKYMTDMGLGTIIEERDFKEKDLFSVLNGAIKGMSEGTDNSVLKARELSFNSAGILADTILDMKV